jgi:hypothetical protein
MRKLVLILCSMVFVGNTVADDQVQSITGYWDNAVGAGIRPVPAAPFGLRSLLSGWLMTLGLAKFGKASHKTSGL